MLYLEQLLLPRGDREAFNAEVSLLCAVADAEAEAGRQHVAVQQADCFGSYRRRAVFGVSEAAVLSAEVHHQPELPERPHGAEEGDQQVLVGVPWDLADEDLAPGSWRWTVPP